MSTPKKPTWLEEVKPVMRLLRYSIPMERAYCDWIKRFVSHHAMGRREDVLRESTALPVSLIPLVKNHLAKVQAIHQHDVAHGHGEVSISSAWERKYRSAGREWGWHSVFPSRNLAVDKTW